MIGLSQRRLKNLAEESKALKTISFPEMDSVGLPSSYVCKVLACLGKWQTKLIGLAEPLDSRDPSLKPFLS